MVLPPHTVPQLPQLPGSYPVSMQPLEQQVPAWPPSPIGHQNPIRSAVQGATQSTTVQIWPAGQPLLQPPPQPKDLQTPPLGQAVPQPWQLFGSLLKSTQASPQQVPKPPEARMHALVANGGAPLQLGRAGRQKSAST